ELLQQLFSKTATSGKTIPTVISGSRKFDVSVKVGELKVVKPGTPVPDVTVGVSNEPNVQLGALMLLSTIGRDEFKLPLARLVASDFDPLIAAGLQVAEQRGEALPLDSVLTLVASPDPQVSRLAAQSLGLSASVADIP